MTYEHLITKKQVEAVCAGHDGVLMEQMHDKQNSRFAEGDYLISEGDRKTIVKPKDFLGIYRQVGSSWAGKGWGV